MTTAFPVGTTHAGSYAGVVPDWGAEYARLRAADAAAPLPPEDLEQLATAAFLLGHDDELVALRERAHEAYLAAGRTDEAVLCGFWVSFHLQNRGAVAQSAGWAARLRRLVPDDPGSRLCALLTTREAASLMMSGEAAQALTLFDRCGRILEEHGDLDGFVLTALGRSRCLEMSGRSGDAAEAVDEVMAHVVTGRVSPQIIGLAYCVMIDLCLGWYDLPRAREWTQALTAWIDQQHGIVPYRGACLVHRAEIQQLRGAWDEAARTAIEACDQLAQRPEPILGDAHYRQAELDRVRGRYADAERSFEAAAQCGAEVQPGLALLRLAKGQVSAAAAGLDRALVESDRPRRRPALLAARVDVALAAAEMSVAARCCDELETLASDTTADWIHALADRARGAVLLAQGDSRAALPVLRRAWTRWQRLDAPYEAACTRVLVGRACGAIGDTDAERMELDAARTVLAQLGAVPALAAISAADVGDGPLSERERQVLRLIATGATNRAIAEHLVLSEKTVARHVSNIFTKLGVTSRSAATAYAFEHGLS